MRPEELTPVEREAWLEVEAAEGELERAQLRLMAVLSRSRTSRHLQAVDSAAGEPCEGRR